METDPRGAPPPLSTALPSTIPRPRVRFEFVGDLDDAPTNAAAMLARVVRLLLQHTDEHDGRNAVLEIVMSGPRLSLVLSDPECASGCLTRSGHLARVAAQRVAVPGHAHLRLSGGEGHGRLLSWALDPSSTFTCTTDPPLHHRR